MEQYNAPSSYTVTINLSDIPPNLDADHAQDILTALNNINSSVNTADKKPGNALKLSIIPSTIITMT